MDILKRLGAAIVVVLMVVAAVAILLLPVWPFRWPTWACGLWFAVVLSLLCGLALWAIEEE